MYRAKDFIAALLLVIVMLGVSGCVSAGTEDESTLSTANSVSTDESAVTDPLAVESWSLEIMDDESFNALSEEERVYVAKKLYSTLYKSIDIVSLKAAISSGTFISDFKKLLESDAEQSELDRIVMAPYEELADGKGSGDAISAEKSYVDKEVVGRLIFTKLDREHYSNWMAYVLDHTILFSPAWEVDTMLNFPQHVLNNFNRLRDRIYQNRPIKEIVLEHMVSVENWARFRSPEDNGREMLEVWLYDFDDSHVPLAAEALKNWSYYTYFEWPYNKYTFIDGVGDEDNDITVNLLGRQLRTGLDFFNAVIDNENFMPTVVDRLVSRFMPNLDADTRAEAVEQIVASNPDSFKDIFDQIIFSKLYLLESDRSKTIEEVVLAFMDNLKFRVDAKTYTPLLTAFNDTNQKILTYKLGREDKAPVDTLSFGSLHKYVREYLMLNRDESDVYPDDDGIDYDMLTYRYDDSNLSVYLDDLFLDFLGRKATLQEHQTLESYFLSTETYQGNILGNLDDPGSKSYIVMAVLDYISRLSEFYQYRKVEERKESL